jgi:hypothetical protein
MSYTLHKDAKSYHIVHRTPAEFGPSTRLRLSMPERVYRAADGVEVHLSLERWVNHILDGHPELQIGDLEDAILRPVRISQDINKPLHRVYEGATHTTGFMRRNTHSIVIVNMRNAQVGDVVTLYLGGLHYKGVQLWP